MSFYTKFQDVESILSATSTSATLGATDVVLGFSFTDGRAHAIPVSQLSAPGIGTIATTNSTATNIGNQGLTLIKSTGGSSCGWTLTDPTQAGQVKTLVFASSTTSTAYVVTTVAASIASSAGFSGLFVNLGSTATGQCINTGISVTLASLSSTQWIVIGKNGNVTSVSTFIIPAGYGPFFT